MFTLQCPCCPQPSQAPPLFALGYRLFHESKGQGGPSNVFKMPQKAPNGGAAVTRQSFYKSDLPTRASPLSSSPVPGPQVTPEGTEGRGVVGVGFFLRSDPQGGGWVGGSGRIPPPREGGGRSHPSPIRGWYPVWLPAHHSVSLSSPHTTHFLASPGKPIPRRKSALFHFCSV